MSGSSVVINLQASETYLDGSGGGEQVLIESWATSVAEAPAVPLHLTDAVTPRTLALPAGGARVLIVQVKSSTTAPTLIWTDALGTKSQQFDGGFAVFSGLNGPPITAASIKGLADVRVFAAG